MLQLSIKSIIFQGKIYVIYIFFSFSIIFIIYFWKVIKKFSRNLKFCINSKKKIRCRVRLYKIIFPNVEVLTLEVNHSCGDY